MKCPICGSPDTNLLFRGSSLLHCEDCGYFWTPMPDEPDNMWDWMSSYCDEAERKEEQHTRDLECAAPSRPTCKHRFQAHSEPCYEPGLYARIMARDMRRGYTNRVLINREYNRERSMSIMLSDLRGLAYE